MTTISRGLDQGAITALDRLAAARATRQPCAPVRDLLPAADIDAAYAVQSAWVAGQLETGARVVGRKIGLTSPAVQAQLGVGQPDFGVLLDTMACVAGAPVDRDRTLQPKIEAEVAFVLAHDLDGGIIGPAEVAAATAYVVAALEIVDSRIAGWDISIVDTVADNASSGLFVLGDRKQRLGRLDLAKCAMTMRQGGRKGGQDGKKDGRGSDVVSTGTGAACLGHPLAASARPSRKEPDEREHRAQPEVRVKPVPVQ